MEKLGRRLAAAALLLGAAFLCVYPLLRPDFAASAVAAMPLRVMIDAGHGGEDGGALSVTGTPESGINLDIALRVRDLLAFAGVQPLMIRTTDTAVYTGSCASITEKKVSDLKNRVKTVNDAAPELLVSIHQNFSSRANTAARRSFLQDPTAAGSLPRRCSRRSAPALTLQTGARASRHSRCI